MIAQAIFLSATLLWRPIPSPCARRGSTACTPRRSPASPRRGDSELTAFNAAADAKALGRPGGGIEETACVLIDWAMDHHGAWFRALER
jgi:hypothetical protein